MFQERITNTVNGSITSIQAVYVPADDITDPAPASLFSHLDATTVLSRDLARMEIYPSIDPFPKLVAASPSASMLIDKVSKQLMDKVVAESHCQLFG